jgi:transporter family protein
MILQYGILLALLTAILWAIADFLSKILMDKNESEYYVLAFISLTGAVAIFIISLIFGKLENILNIYLLVLIGLGILEVLAYEMFLKTIKHGKLSLAMPIAYSSSAVTLILSLIFYRELLNFPQALAILGIIIGIFIVAHKQGKIKSHLPIFTAITSMILYGIYYFLLKIPLQVFNPYTVSWMAALTTGLLSLFYASIKHKNFLTRKDIGISSVVGLFVSGGFLLFLFAINIAPVGIVATVKSIAPVIGIILAGIVLKEKLSKKELVGIVLAIVGIIILSLF